MLRFILKLHIIIWSEKYYFEDLPKILQKIIGITQDIMTFFNLRSQDFQNNKIFLKISKNFSYFRITKDGTCSKSTHSNLRSAYRSRVRIRDTSDSENLKNI